jgi:hypothetical protein
MLKLCKPQLERHSQFILKQDLYKTEPQLSGNSVYRNFSLVRSISLSLKKQQTTPTPWPESANYANRAAAARRRR